MPDVSETTQAKTQLADAHKTINMAHQPGMHNDPDAQKLAATARTDAAAAQHRIEAARSEAIQQLRKLAQTYEFSAQQVNSVAPPTFSPPAGNAGSRDWWGYDKSHLSPANTYSGPRESGSVHGLAGGGAAGRPSVEPPTASTASGRSAPHIGDRPGHTAEPAFLGIDSVDTQQRTPQPSAVPTPAEPTSTHREPPLLGQAGPGLSAPARSGGAAGANPAPRSVAGRVTQPAGSMPRLPRETGIVGGRPIANAGRPTSAIPRGNVIGKVGPQGHTPPGRGMSPGSPVNANTRSGSGSGRRLSSETGGIVGARPGRPGREADRPFTAGGSGLIRPSSNSSKQQEQREARRPDYLTEEEETWTPTGHRPLPPVIG
jgi:hypothetical protein